MKRLAISILSAAILAFSSALIAVESDRLLAQDVSEEKIREDSDLLRERIEADANKSISDFAETKPEFVFERVRYSMADFIEADLNVDLNLAYVLAVDFHFNVTAENYRDLGLSYQDFKYLKSRKTKTYPFKHKLSLIVLEARMT